MPRSRHASDPEIFQLSYIFLVFLTGYLTRIFISQFHLQITLRQHDKLRFVDFLIFILIRNQEQVLYHNTVDNGYKLSFLKLYFRDNKSAI